MNRPEPLGRYQLVVDTVSIDPGPDPLMTLDEASELPDIAGLFSVRALQRAAKDGELKASMRRGRLHVRASWITQWIEDGTQWHDRPNPHVSTGLPPAARGKSETSETTESGSAWDAINALRRKKRSLNT